MKGLKLSHNVVTGALALLGTPGSEPTKDGEEFWEAAVILLVACGFLLCGDTQRPSLRTAGDRLVLPS